MQVFTVTDGLAPEEIEKYVTFPVEVAMNGLPGITEIRSVSNFGLSVVNVYFEDDIDIYFARQVGGERLQEAREQIPEGFGDPEMGPISTGMGLILFYYIEDTTGRYTLEELRSIQDWIVKFQLQTVPGVTEVLGIGGWEKQFHVEVDPMALLRYDVSLAAVIDAIHANNLNVGAQFLERNSEEIVVRSVGLATGITDLERVVIKTVDGTIVMVENIDRMLRDAKKGESRIDIIARASREVARPILFAISIIVIVFLPLFTLQGVEGKTFRPLAYTVAMAMFGSLIYALLISPVMAWLLMRRPKTEGPSLSNRVVAALNRPYEPLVRFFVRHRGVAVSLGGALLAFGALILPQLGSEFTPALQEGTLVLRLTMAPSIALTESTQVALRVERHLMELEEVESIVSRIGRGEVGAHTDPVNSAEMYLFLKPKDQWRVDSQVQLEDLIREHLGEIPGVLMNFTQPIQMAVDELLEGVRAELAVKLFGDDLEILKQKADEIAGVVGQVRGAADVQADQITGTPQLLIRVDREAVARWGLNVEDVQNVIRAAVGGETAGQVFEGVRRFEILVRYPKEYRDTPEAIGSILVPTLNGATVPLSQVVEMREIVGPRQITRENGQRFITVQCNVVDRDIGSFVAEGRAAIDAGVDLPPGYLVTWGGQFELQRQANKRLALVVPVTLLLIVVLLYVSFNSLRSTVLILLNIPLALVGGVAALWISGQNLSVPASVGFIALFGIALENGMVLVTTLNQLVRQGMAIDEASVQGAMLRLRPVLMTATTTALGLIPLLLSSGTGSEVQRPLATVVIGGLATSTVLTLLVLPAIFRWFAEGSGGEGVVK